MKINSDKSHILMSGNKKTAANIDHNCIESEDVHELLVITIGLKLTIENHINKLCNKASKKLNALARSSNYMAFDKRKKRTKLHYTSLATASYVDVLQRLSEKISASHKRALRITQKGTILLHLMNY